jgi:hypothetical protein
VEKIKGKLIFLIDAFGAVFSAGCLCIFLSFEDVFGMPAHVVRLFISLAVVLSMYSFTCYFARPKAWQRYLTIIALLNIGYSLLTLYHVLQNSGTLTRMGYSYFAAELLVIWALSFYELKLAKSPDLNTSKK